MSQNLLMKWIHWISCKAIVIVILYILDQSEYKKVYHFTHWNFVIFGIRELYFVFLHVYQGCIFLNSGLIRLQDLFSDPIKRKHEITIRHVDKYNLRNMVKSIKGEHNKRGHHHIFVDLDLETTELLLRYVSTDVWICHESLIFIIWGHNYR